MAISVTVAIGFGMVIPVLPLYAKSFGVGLAAVGLVQLLFGFTRFSFNLVGGLVVDRFGDRASTMTGLLVVAASSYAAGLATSFPQLVLARGFGGAGSALFIAGLQNRILRIIEPEAMGRATGAFRSSFLVGTAAGPLLGGIVAKHFGLSAPFHFYATGLLVATVIAWIVMREEGAARVRPPRRSPADALRAARPLFKDVRYLGALFATFAGWWMISGPAQTIGPVFGQEKLGLSEDSVGLAITMLAVGEAAVLAFVGRLSDRYGRRATLLPGLVLTAVSVALLGQIEGITWAFYPLMILTGAGIATGSISAGGLLGDSIPREGSGAAVGVNQMAGDLGYLLAPTVVGLLAEHGGFRLAYGLAALPAVAALLFALRLPRGVAGTEDEGAEDIEPATPIG